MRSRIIAPAVLAHTFSEFETQVKKIDIGLFQYMHVDVMDGKFVPHTSFGELEQIAELPIELPIELHFMVEDPLAELEKWSAVSGVFRAIFHVESPHNLEAAMALAEDTDLGVGLAINPDTSLTKLIPYLDRIDLVQFMTVHPGAQGAQFQEKVLQKIAEFNNSREGILMSVDGAVSAQTIPLLTEHGVDIFNVGSAFMHSPDVTKTYQTLKAMLV